jgi:nitroreductase
MNLLELITKRYSERRYSSQPVSDDDLLYMLSCANMAPSAVNKQPWHFYVIRGEKLLQFGDVYRRETFKEAPLCLVVTGNHAQSWHRNDGKDHCDIDIAIVADHIIMAATERGINTCWVCNFDVPLCKELLQLSDDEEPMVLIPMGYALPGTQPNPKKRKDLNDIVTYL